MKTLYIVQNRNRAKDVELSENERTVRSGSLSMVGLKAERRNTINIKSKAMQPFDLSMSQFCTRQTDHELANVAHPRKTCVDKL